MGEFVHFRGVDNIIQAYERNKIPAWAFISGKDILAQYVGDDLDEGSGILREWIDAVKESMSQGIYQLRIYVDPPKTIGLKTDWNYSFKMRLVDPDLEEDGGKGTNRRYYDRRIDDLERKLLEQGRQRDQEDDETEIPTMQTAIAGMLSRTEVQDFVMKKIFGFVDNLFTNTPPAGAAVAGVPDSTQEEYVKAGEGLTPNEQYQRLPEQERKQLDQAMAILFQHDPMIGTNLLKVATVLKNDPKKYRLFAQMI